MRIAVLLLSCAAFPATAAVAPEQAPRLASQLSPIGAERAAGSRPAGPARIDRQSKPADEFDEAEDPPARVAAWGAAGVGESDQPLFTINAVNVGRYRENLTESHFLLVQTYPNTYFMKVYPSRRPVRWPREIEEATRLNATACTLKGSDELEGCATGFPFPLPRNGAEVIWNHKLRWRGDTLERDNDQLVVKADGSYHRTRLHEAFDFRYARLKGGQPLGGNQREIFRYLSRGVEPARLAGNALLLHERMGSGAGGRLAWSVVPGSKRVRRDTKACCDYPPEGADGMQFYDQVDMFSGSLDRYAWNLLGKREIFVPYNATALLGARPADLIRPAHLNQDLLRYELHRVWVVEATLRSGATHTLRKRRFYVDEDSWTIVAVDMLDNYDQPYQFQEGHLHYSVAAQRPEFSAEAIYHLSRERYFITGLRGTQAPQNPASYAADHFEPDRLTRIAAGSER